MEWRDGALLRAALTGDRTLTVRTGDRSARVTIRSGAALHLDGQLRSPASARKPMKPTSTTESPNAKGEVFGAETSLSGCLQVRLILRRMTAREHSTIGQVPEFSIDISLALILPPIRRLDGWGTRIRT